MTQSSRVRRGLVDAARAAVGGWGQAGGLSLPLPVPNPRYRPRDYCQDPQKFGRAGVAWLSPRGQSESGLTQRSAAQLQHAFALLVRAALKDQAMTVTAYAELTRQDPKRVSRLLSGEIMMRLEDAAAAQRHLRVGFTPHRP